MLSWLVKAIISDDDPIIFYGVDSIKVIDKRLELIEALAMHWLEDCAGPDWCEGSDVDKDGVVNFRDFALAEGFCVEVISE